MQPSHPTLVWEGVGAWVAAEVFNLGSFFTNHKSRDTYHGIERRDGYVLRLKEEEIRFLEEDANFLREELNQIEKRLEELKK